MLRCWALDRGLPRLGVGDHRSMALPTSKSKEATPSLPASISMRAIGRANCFHYHDDKTSRGAAGRTRARDPATCTIGLGLESYTYTFIVPCRSPLVLPSTLKVVQSLLSPPLSLTLSNGSAARWGDGFGGWLPHVHTSISAARSRSCFASVASGDMSLVILLSIDTYGPPRVPGGRWLLSQPTVHGGRRRLEATGGGSGASFPARISSCSLWGLARRPFGYLLQQGLPDSNEGGAMTVTCLQLFSLLVFVAR